MTKKDYIAVAKILVETDDDCRYGMGGHDAVAVIRDRLATLFANDNSHFDRQRFLDACKPWLQD